MRTTLKVAELATFIYALLVFGSLIIANAYYSVFNVNITNYMTFSEILLLFLGKKWMYWSILTSPILLFFCDSRWPKEPLSSPAKYSYIARTSDILIVANSLSLIYLLYTAFDFNFKSILGFALMPCFCLVALPSTLQTLLLAYGGFVISCILYPKDVFIDTGFINYYKWYFTSVADVKSRIHLGADGKEHFGYYTRLRILVSDNFPGYMNRYFDWIYRHKAFYCIILLATYTVLTLSNANRILGVAVLEGRTDNIKSVSISLNDDSGFSRTNLTYIGECKEFFFLYDSMREETIVIKRADVFTESIKKTVGRHSSINGIIEVYKHDSLRSESGHSIDTVSIKNTDISEQPPIISQSGDCVTTDS